jgi:hypothetical protein
MVRRLNRLPALRARERLDRHSSILRASDPKKAGELGREVRGHSVMAVPAVCSPTFRVVRRFQRAHGTPEWLTLSPLASCSR